MNTETTPTAPYAVMVGMPGYSPNTCHHYETLSEALEAVADELDRSAEAFGELAWSYALDNETGLAVEARDDSAAAQAYAELVRSAARNGKTVDGDTFATGDSWRASEHERIFLEPISPADYEASDE